jgi:hypothetical protein
MADLADTERQAVWPLHFPDPVGIVINHPRSPRVSASGEKILPAPGILQ